MQKFLGDFRELPTLRAAKNAMQQELVTINQNVGAPSRITLTFRTAATQWLKDCEQRKQKPVKVSVAHLWRGILRRHLLPLLGELSLADCGNRTMKSLIERLAKKNLSPQTIHSICAVMKQVVSSATDADGNQLFPMIWNRRFIDMPSVDPSKQNTPCFTAEQVSQIVASASGERLRMATILLASSGLRIGEMTGLECKHFDGSCLKIEQSVWEQKVCTPKTRAAYRNVDLTPEVCTLLREFIGQRTSGFIFNSCHRKPITSVNLMVRELHPLLKSLGIPKSGFHAFRRYRNTHLRQTRCPDSLLKYWMGHSSKGMSDLYDKSSEDLAYRRDVCRAMGVGFVVPKTVLSGVTGVSEDSTKTLETIAAIG
jgi:integrase